MASPPTLLSGVCRWLAALAMSLGALAFGETEPVEINKLEGFGRKNHMFACLARLHAGDEISFHCCPPTLYQVNSNVSIGCIAHGLLRGWRERPVLSTDWLIYTVLQGVCPKFFESRLRLWYIIHIAHAWCAILMLETQQTPRIPCQRNDDGVVCWCTASCAVESRCARSRPAANNYIYISVPCFRKLPFPRKYRIVFPSWNNFVLL